MKLSQEFKDEIVDKSTRALSFYHFKLKTKGNRKENGKFEPTYTREYKRYIDP